jgi:hypothetical protein
VWAGLIWLRKETRCSFFGGTLQSIFEFRERQLSTSGIGLPGSTVCLEKTKKQTITLIGWTINDVYTTVARSNCHCVGFEVPAAVVMKRSVFWDITPRSPLYVNRCFGGTCRLHLQGQRISQPRHQREVCYLLLLCYILCLFSDPEDGGDMFLRNVGLHSTDQTALYTRR